jgi:tRNA(Ile)-lysidine synthase
VLVAVSGGPDSIALAHVLHDLQRAGGFALAGLAHLNHQLRGDAADADERFCRDVAASLGLPIDVESMDVASLARDWDVSLEAAARRARYAFLERAASRLRADRVASGHTRNDQAETFLLRLLRGAGPGGLAGIRPRSGAVIRPLLDATRDEVLVYLRERGLEWRDDASNADVAIPRNRVRHELIPLLEARFTPGIVDVLAREATIARDDAEWLDRCAIETAPTVVLSNEGGRARLDAARLASVPLPVARRIVRDVLQTVEGARFAGFEHVDAVIALADSTAAQTVDLPGVRAGRAAADIVIERRESQDRGTRQRRAPRGPSPEARGTNGFCYPLSIPGEVRIPEAGWSISAERVDSGAVPGRRSPDEVVVQAAKLGTELAVRSRRPGDAFRPVGLGGRKKLQDFFVDRKIARPERDRVPIVVDGGDRIVWVVGQAVAEDFTVTGPAEGVILLKARRLGGPG